MGFFDFIKSKTLKPIQQLDINGGLRLSNAEVDVMFIVDNNQIIYVNYNADNLFTLDKDGDQKLDGRIVKFHFFNKYNRSLDIFVAFDEQDSYAMFTLQAGLEERLNYVANAICEYFHKKNFLQEFLSEAIQVQFEYTFKLYRNINGNFMVNNGQSQAYIIDKDNNFSTANDMIGVDLLKKQFWEL